MPNSPQEDRLPHFAAYIGADYADSFAACREVMGAMFDLEAPSPEVAANYVMDFAVYDYGPIKLGQSRSSASIMTRSPQTIARTGVNQFHVQFYKSHGFIMTLDGAEHQVAPGDVCLLDLTRPVMIRTDGIDNQSVIIERELLEPLLADPGDFHAVILRRDTEAGVAVREHLEEMWRQGSELTVAEGLEWSRATAALLAAVVKAGSQHRAATRAELRKSQFRAIRRRIDRDISDPTLGPATLTAQFFITRPTLYRMFEPYGGIGKYILGRRLTGVFRDLSAPSLAHEKVATIMRSWGLENHTTAGRVFRATWGMTPSECRRRALALHESGTVPGADAFRIPEEMPVEIAAHRNRTGAPGR